MIGLWRGLNISAQLQSTCNHLLGVVKPFARRKEQFSQVPSIPQKCFKNTLVGIVSSYRKLHEPSSLTKRAFRLIQVASLFGLKSGAIRQPLFEGVNDALNIAIFIGQYPVISLAVYKHERQQSN